MLVRSKGIKLSHYHHLLYYLWEQPPHFLLELDIQYTKSVSTLKKLQGKTSTSLASILDANTDDENPEEAEQENMMIEMLPENLENIELNKLKKIINQIIIIQRNNPSKSLPVPAAVR